MKTTLLIAFITGEFWVRLLGGVEMQIYYDKFRIMVWHNQKIYVGFQDDINDKKSIILHKHQADSIYNSIKFKL